MGFGSLGFSELLVIFVIVLVFFGPRRFPEVARSLGSAMREFRRSLNQIQRELEDADPRKDLPGRELLDEFRSAKAGKWLDPNRTRTPEHESRNAAEQTREATGTGEAMSRAAGFAGTVASPAEPASAGAEGDEQLPMFEGQGSAAEREAAEPRPASDPADAPPDGGSAPDVPPTEDSRSG